MTLEDRIKRLEREWDHLANPEPYPETVAHWTILWIDGGMEEPRVKAAAPDLSIASLQERSRR